MDRAQGSKAVNKYLKSREETPLANTDLVQAWITGAELYLLPAYYVSDGRTLKRKGAGLGASKPVCKEKRLGGLRHGCGVRH